MVLLAMKILLGFRLEPPIKPRKEKPTLGTQIWQSHQTKNPQAADLWEYKALRNLPYIKANIASYCLFLNLKYGSL